MKHIFILLLLLPTVSAISVTPAKYELDFEPGFSYDFEFQVRNNAGYKVGASISLDGELAQYATVSTNKIDDIESWQPFTVSLTLPESLPTPGKNILKIAVVEEIENSGGMVARTAVVPWVVVDVPYPGVYAELGDLTIADGAAGVNEGEDTPITFTVRNRGSEILKDTIATVELLDQETVLEQHQFNIFILPEEDYTESLILNTSLLQPNSYLAKVTYVYEDITLTKDSSFLIGHFNVTLDGRTKQVERTGIVPIIISVKSLWKGITYVEAILDFEGLQQIRTPEQRLPGFGNAALTAYLDTNLVKTDTIEGDLLIQYYRDGGEKLTNKYSFSLNITEPEVPPEPEESSSVAIIILIMGLVLIVNVVVLIKVWKK